MYYFNGVKNLHVTKVVKSVSTCFCIGFYLEEFGQDSEELWLLSFVVVKVIHQWSCQYQVANLWHGPEKISS